jgi:hypothetical protein
VTAERRLAKLEGALSPKAATLLWLAEAHQFGSLPAYVDWLIDQPISAAPFERVPEQARAAAVEALRGQPKEAVREAGRGAVRDAIFGVELVLRLNSVAEETIKIEGLRYAVFFWEMRAFTAEAELARRSRSHAAPLASSLVERWQAWCAGTAALLIGLYAAAEARALLERRYLDGHPALFPDATADWERLRGECRASRWPGRSAPAAGGGPSKRASISRDQAPSSRPRRAPFRSPRASSRRGFTADRGDPGCDARHPRGHQGCRRDDGAASTGNLARHAGIERPCHRRPAPAGVVAVTDS